MEKTAEQERKRNEEEEIRRDRDDHRRKSNLHPLKPCAELQHPGMRRVISGSVAMTLPWWHNGSCTCSSQACRRLRQAHRLHRMQDALARAAGNSARPYIVRLMSFNLVTCPSTIPFLIGHVKPALTAALSFSIPQAKDWSSARSLLATCSHQTSNRCPSRLWTIAKKS